MPFATVHSGTQAIKHIYEQALSSRAIDFICLSDTYQKVLGNWFDAEYEPRLHDGKRRVREILAGPTLPVTQTDLVLTPTSAALISFGSQPGAVVIEDANLIQFLHQVFENIWKIQK